MTSRRIGSFTVKNRFFLNLEGGAGTNLFHGMVVLRAEPDWSMDNTRYMAHHQDFDLVHSGEMIPEYEPVFAEEPDGYGYAYGVPKWVRKNEKG